MGGRGDKTRHRNGTSNARLAGSACSRGENLTCGSPSPKPWCHPAAEPRTPPHHGATDALFPARVAGTGQHVALGEIRRRRFVSPTPCRSSASGAMAGTSSFPESGHGAGPNTDASPCGRDRLRAVLPSLTAGSSHRSGSRQMADTCRTGTVSRCKWGRSGEWGWGSGPGIRFAARWLATRRFMLDFVTVQGSRHQALASLSALLGPATGDGGEALPVGGGGIEGGGRPGPAADRDDAAARHLHRDASGRWRDHEAQAARGRRSRRLVRSDVCVAGVEPQRGVLPVMVVLDDPTAEIVPAAFFAPSDGQRPRRCRPDVMG